MEPRMTDLGRFVLSIPLVILLSCGGGGDQPAPQLSQGLKIFVTARVHGADFANDPFLVGTTAIQKADQFCNTDSNTPAQGKYKALLVDGVNRDAKTLTDWVLQPTTKYYRTFGNVEIGTTSASAIFGAAFQPLTNSVQPPPTEYPGFDYFVWTGIGTASDFSTGPDCCSGWSDMTNSHFTSAGVPFNKDGTAFTSGGSNYGCGGFQFHLYCVEQP
jgi:Protein of unknown function (DUF1554)